MEHLRELAVVIGTRPAGSPSERRAAEYIRDELSSYGYDAELQPFPVDTYVETTSSLELLSPLSASFDATAIAGSVSGRAEGTLADVGYGRTQEIGDIAGKIAVAQRGEIGFSEKAYNAANAGAVALVIYNTATGVLGQVVYDLPAIPVVIVQHDDGLAILDSIRQSPGQTASVAVEGTVVVSESANVVARTPGTVCRAVIGGHYDSVIAGPGANDNASGAATVIEMARVLAVRGQAVGVCIALFGAEEAGLIGSDYYVSQMSEADHAALEGMLNFDMFGVGDSWSLIGDPPLTGYAEAAARELGLDFEVVPVAEAPAGSDHAPFAALGVPVLFLNCFCDPNYHQPSDIADFVRPPRLAQAGQVGLSVLEALLPAN